MTKFKQFTSTEAFSAKFSMTTSGKTMDGTQNVCRVKWWPRPPLSSCKIWWKSNDARRRERTKCDFFLLSLLPAGSARRAALSVLFLLTSRFFGFSPRKGDMLHRWRWNFARFALTAKFHFDRFRSGGYGQRSQKLKKMKFYLYNPLHDFFTKFTRFMRVHNCAKFGCFISINDKIINNLPRWKLTQQLTIGFVFATRASFYTVAKPYKQCKGFVTRWNNIVAYNLYL